MIFFLLYSYPYLNRVDLLISFRLCFTHQKMITSASVNMFCIYYLKNLLFILTLLYVFKISPPNVRFPRFRFRCNIRLQYVKENDPENFYDTFRGSIGVYQAAESRVRSNNSTI